MNWSTLANISQVLAVFVFPVIFFGGRLIWRKLIHELTPNHGTSLRDAVDRIEKNLDELVKVQKAQQRVINKVKKELETHLSEVA